MSDRFSTHVRGLPDAPAWLSVILPAVVYPVLMLSIFVYQPFYDIMTCKECGVEYLAVALLVFGVAHGVLLLVRYRDRLPAKWLVWWFALATLGAFVFAGEEISWGQHLGLWDSEQVPAAIRAVNDQNETNLHNISNMLDQGPTNLIVGATFLAFVLLPLFLRSRGETMGTDNPGYWFWPTRAGFITALGVLIIPFPKRFYEWFVIEGQASELWRHSEIHEFYIALLMAIYLVSVHHRLRAMPPRGKDAEARAQQPVEETV